MTKFVPSDEQREIIGYPLEPLRVAAGAGTGKTTTIVERIADLVKGGIDPLRVLGVTFTNKAANELNQRVVAALGDDADGQTPEISTYHGFAVSILNEFGVFVGRSRAVVLMDEGHRVELATRVLTNFDTVDLDLTGLASRRKEMLKLSASMTDNLTDFDGLRAAAPPDPDEIWKKRLALGGAAALYEAEKRRLGMLEFSDLIKSAVETIETHPDVAAEIASRYDVVVLDEYQDTDAAQRRLLVGLFAHRVPVIAVGDANQMIYAWRGASSANFDAFPSDFPRSDSQPTETKPLSENRRSDRLILDLGNILSKLVPDIEGAEPLRPTADAERGEVVTAWFNSDTSEATWIASEMILRHDNGVAWSNMAVLCRNRTQLKVIAEALGMADVPYSVMSMGELLDVPEISDLLAWLRVLHDVKDDPSLLRIWLGGRFRLGLGDITLLKQWCDEHRGRSLVDAAADAASIEELTPGALTKLSSFVDLYNNLLQTAQLATAPVITAAVIESLGFWDEVGALPQARATTTRINLSRFIGVVRQWRPLDGSANLGSFLSYLSALAETDASDVLAASQVTSADAVTVQTIHSAKGLEWSDVYLPSIAEKTFPSSVKQFDDPARFGELLPYDMRLDADSFDDAAAADNQKDRSAVLFERHLEEEWRLGYVAVTRAAHRLVVSGHTWHGTIKTPRQPSEFYTIAHEMEGTTHGPSETIAPINNSQKVFVQPVLPPDPLFADGTAAALRRAVADPLWLDTEHLEYADEVSERVAQLELAIDDLSSPLTVEKDERFVVSVTNLVTLAGCPQKFKWIHHDRLPRKPRASAVFGTAFHRRIELHNLGVIAFDDPEMDGDTTGRHDVPSFGKSETTSDPWALFEDSRLAKEKPLLVETPFEIALGKGSIRGKVDAIYEPRDGEWEIVDYKSGRHRDDQARDIQLKVYAIAADDGALSTTPPTAIDVTFAYFGGDELVETTETVDEQWLADARREVESLVDQGRDGPFQTTPSAECTWCDFLHLCPDGQAEVARRARS